MHSNFFSPLIWSLVPIQVLHVRTFLPSQKYWWRAGIACWTCCKESLASLQGKSQISKFQRLLLLAGSSFSNASVLVLSVSLSVFTRENTVPKEVHYIRLCAMLCQPDIWTSLSELAWVFLDKVMCLKGALGFPWEFLFTEDRIWNGGHLERIARPCSMSWRWIAFHSCATSC